MIKQILNSQLFHYLTIGGILMGVVLCVFPDLIPRFSWLVNYAVPLMLLYLFSGLGMLILGQSRLTFAFFGGCVLLCFFLKFSIRADGIDRWRQNMIKKENTGSSSNPVVNAEFKLAHINLTNTNEPAEIFEQLRTSDPDIVSLHEVTPANEQLLKDSLAQIYPYSHTMVDLGIFGMAIFSKHELMQVDTLYYGDFPNIVGKISINGDELDFVNIHTMPALDEYSAQRMREHLDTIAAHSSSENGPLMVFGDFNAVSWSSQVQHLLDKSGLMESRLGFMPSSFSRGFPFWDIPLDHIFYSGHFVCTGFQDINATTGGHIGILGTYRFIESAHHAKKTIQ